jgi:hypothetical protein
MVHIAELVIQVLGGDELESYIPDVGYWVLRDLLHTAPSNSIRADDGERADLVVVRIEFRNSSNESIEFRFQNASCKAELLNLEVHDELGMMIPPVRRVHIRPKPNADFSEIVPASGKYVYDLVGEVVDSWLVFPGAKYQIPQNRSLRITFKYGGKTSNVVELHL